MIFLEQTVNQILREEGQVIVSLDDLQVTWDDLEALFIGVYEQSKQYISIYDWVTDTLSTTPEERSDYSHIRHITYMNQTALQRIMPDLNPAYYEFNPYTKNASSIFASNFSLEVGKYPTLSQLDYSTTLTVKKERKCPFVLPCTFRPEDFSFNDMEAIEDDKEKGCLILEGDSGVGKFNSNTLTGYIITDSDYTGTLSVTSKYVGIKELDLSCELFYIWFKAALMQYLGAMKKQMDLTGVGLPFDLNADGLLERGRQLMDKVEELKGTKQHWSNF